MTFTPGQVLTAAQMNDLLAATMPTGALTPFAASTVPTGWLLCDGTGVSRTTYADLFSVIGTTYGAGNGSTTFNLPNLKGRVPVGLDSADTQFDALGETGGAKTHTLTTAEMPVHTHTQSSHTHTQSSHSHSGTTDTGLTNGSWTVPAGSGTSVQPNHLVGFSASATVSLGDNAQFPGSSHDHTYSTNSQTPIISGTTATNANTGSGNSHNNLQPYITLNFIIKA